MSVHKITHSRGISYEMRIRVDGRLVRKRFPTRKAANDEYARLRQAGNDGTFLAPADTKTTFGAYAETWFAGLAVRPSTMASYRGNYRVHLQPVFGATRLDRISRQDVLALLNALRAKGLAERTVRGVYNLLRMILRAAVLDRKLTTTPCYKIALPTLPPKNLAVFTPEQVGALMAVVKPEHYALIATGLGTGLRQAELLGVTVDALDLDHAALHVRAQLLTPLGKGAPYLTELLKTPAAYRVMPLPQFTVDALRAHLERYGTGPNGLLFTTGRGNPWRRGTVNSELWKPLLQRAGLASGFGMHALRHTYAATLIDQGLHPKVIQARLGHASISETMDTYGHLFPDAHAETAAALDRHFSALPSAGRRLRAV